jgi:SOS-response transcriptional repressor LexA
MFKESSNGLRQQSTQEILEKTVNFLIEEQIRNFDRTFELEQIYHELKNRERLDLYNDAINIATKRAVEISEIIFEYQNSEIKEIVPVLAKELKRKIQDNSIRYKSLSAIDFLPLITAEKKLHQVEIRGDSMIGANIFDGDEAIVVLNEPIRNNDIVIVNFEGERLIKRYVEKDGGSWLISENEKYSPIKITNDYNIEFIGVVKSIIHKV